MWLIISLTDSSVVGFYHNRDFCFEALSILEHTKPEFFEYARLVAYYVDSDELQHYLNPIIMACLDANNIVLS